MNRMGVTCPMLSVRTLLIPLAFLGGSTLTAQSDGKRDLSTTAFVLPVEGKVMDNKDVLLVNATVRVKQDGKELAKWSTDSKGRFDIILDIGGLYAIDVMHKDHVTKRFIIDARSDDPSQVITGAFQAFVTLIPNEAVDGVDIEELDFPFALVIYDKNEKAFMADPLYIEQMKRLESSLMLSSARKRKGR
jgi:hypothetical protein